MFPREPHLDVILCRCGTFCGPHRSALRTLARKLVAAAQFQSSPLQKLVSHEEQKEQERRQKYARPRATIEINLKRREERADAAMGI